MAKLAKKLQQRDENGRLLKGARLNPGGRVKIDRHVQDLAREQSPAALKTLAKIMNSDAAPESARVSAANAILDRAWGKPAQESKLSIDRRDRLVDYSDEELTVMLAEQRGELDERTTH